MPTSTTPAPSAASPGAKTEVAFLVFAPLRQRRKDNSFDGNDNVGAKVIADVLTRAGIPVGYCAPETAHRHRVVLVSLTSTYDVFAFYRAVAMLPSWQPGGRTFRVLAGGFGMQNPTSIRRYVDYAAFGRAESWVTPIVEALLGGGEPAAHESLMPLPDLAPVTIAQAAELYPHEVEGFRESFTGCPLKCKFCHYTWARKHRGSDEAYGQYVQTSLAGAGSPELTWDQLFTYDRKAGRIRVAIDGFSERLRYLYGKRISRDDIVAGIERIGRFGPAATTLMVYNIANFPTETEDDRDELYATLRRARPAHRVIFVLHSTPFRPSLATPMQWEPVSLQPDNSALRAAVIAERETFRAVHSFTLETPWSHLLSVVAERATPETDALFHACAFAPALQRGTAADKLRRVAANFDLSPYLRAYDPDEPHPAWFLRSFAEPRTMRQVARRMRADAAASLTGAWRPSGTSLVQIRLKRERAAAGVA